jgi:hypothetical protein
VRKLQVTEADLEKSEDRASIAEAKLKQASVEVTQLTQELRTLEVRFVLLFVVSRPGVMS